MFLKPFNNSRSYEFALPEDVYKGFAKAVEEDATIDPNIDISSFIRYWVDEPGAPVLQVTVDPTSGVINLRQVT